MYANYYKNLADTWEMVLSVNANHQDDVYSNTDNDPKAFTEAYTKVNVSASFRNSNGLELSIFARNVTDEVTATQLLDLPLVPGSHFALWAPGKEVGISLTESRAMYPAASVSGWYFSHPKSVYFSVLNN